MGKRIGVTHRYDSDSGDLEVFSAYEDATLYRGTVSAAEAHLIVEAIRGAERLAYRAGLLDFMDIVQVKSEELWGNA